MITVAPSLLPSNLQSEVYKLHSRAARGPKEDKSHKETATSASSQSKGKSLAEAMATVFEADAAPGKTRADAELNGLSTHASNDRLQKREGINEQKTNGTIGSAHKVDRKGKAVANAESDDDERDDERSEEDESEEELGSAGFLVVEEWQDASASIAGGSMPDAATRNNCV